MTYLTYQEYTEFGGNVSVDAFFPLESKAERLLNHWTMNRLENATTIPVCVKEVLTEMVNIISETSNGDKVTSFSNGKVSFSYDTSKTDEQKMYELALVYLPVSLISGVVAYEN